MSNWRGCNAFAGAIALGLASIGVGEAGEAGAVPARGGAANLALVAAASTSFVSGHETLGALNDGFSPAHSDDKSHGAYGNWPRNGTQWVQYEWSQPVATRQIEVYWFDDQRGVRLPKACRLLRWDGTAFVAVAGAQGFGLEANKFNVTAFPEIVTAKLRIEIDSNGSSSTGVLEWRVLDSGASPNFPPVVDAGVDRVVVQSGATHLSGSVRDDGKVREAPSVRWVKASGPGEVAFGERERLETTARFSAPGEYVVELVADDGQATSTDRVSVAVTAPVAGGHLRPVWTGDYEVSSPFWRPRLRNLIVNWIPHCVRKIEDPATPEGGIGNFVQAGRKLAGEGDARHTGPVFANTWVYNTLEAMCLAQQVGATGDEELAAAQARLRQTVDDWVPKILGAQEPDGYIHTMYTIQGHPRWRNKGDHEGYQAGYLISAAMAHYTMTGGRDTRLFDAARRLADCWVANIGPAPKRAWYEGHQELEQTLVRFARFIEDKEGAGRGRKYVELARFLLDSRRDGDAYDQSHLPVTRQYEAVGHAVRALYSYSGMVDIAMETGDVDYHSAVQSLWNSIVNRKYYVTGGVGSGETSEGFGPDYSLPNNAYCESCANCGELFFQHKMQMAYRDARYADLYEETLYNAILGDVDLEAKNFTYTNPLDSSHGRYLWHGCPCCVGNIPRTLLQLPTWMYGRSADAVYVNLFAGSAVTLDRVAGTTVRLVQTTDYPWGERIRLEVQPAAPCQFTLKIRVPNREVSALYTSTPPVAGLLALSVNGKPVTPSVAQGYAGIAREWHAGDTVEWAVPLVVQRVKGDDRIAATRGRVALRYGPLVYNIESVDQSLDGVLSPSAALATEWRSDLLGGVRVIRGEFADGKLLLAIPNYARLNRGGRSVVWVKDR